MLPSLRSCLERRDRFDELLLLERAVGGEVEELLQGLRDRRRRSEGVGCSGEV
jgi:hypothetical protein